MINHAFPSFPKNHHLRLQASPISSSHPLICRILVAESFFQYKYLSPPYDAVKEYRYQHLKVI